MTLSPAHKNKLYNTIETADSKTLFFLAFIDKDFIEERFSSTLRWIRKNDFKAIAKRVTSIENLSVEKTYQMFSLLRSVPLNERIEVLSTRTENGTPVMHQISRKERLNIIRMLHSADRLQAYLIQNEDKNTILHDETRGFLLLALDELYSPKDCATALCAQNAAKETPLHRQDDKTIIEVMKYILPNERLDVLSMQDENGDIVIASMGQQSMDQLCKLLPKPSKSAHNSVSEMILSRLKQLSHQH